jgi:hypothetical protein
VGRRVVQHQRQEITVKTFPIQNKGKSNYRLALCVFWLLLLMLSPAEGCRRQTGGHSFRTHPASAGSRVAEQAGVFNKYGFDFQLVYISVASMLTGSMFSGSVMWQISGGEGNCAGWRV